LGCTLLNAPYSKNALERSVAGGSAPPAMFVALTKLALRYDVFLLEKPVSPSASEAGHLPRFPVVAQDYTNIVQSLDHVSNRKIRRKPGKYLKNPEKFREIRLSIRPSDHSIAV